MVLGQVQKIYVHVEYNLLSRLATFTVPKRELAKFLVAPNISSIQVKTNLKHSISVYYERETGIVRAHNHSNETVQVVVYGCIKQDIYIELHNKLNKKQNIAVETNTELMI